MLIVGLQLAGLACMGAATWLAARDRMWPLVPALLAFLLWVAADCPAPPLL